MGDIDKALKLYGMMADRCEKSGHAPRQTQVYREMVAFMQGCETAEEASAKIRNSKYFLAPSAALMQDKFAALEQASRENHMPDVADVYRKKIEEIDADIGAMYETGYEMTARNLKIPYIQTCEAFANIYNCYLTLSCRSTLDDVAIQHAIKDLREAMGKLVKPSSNFTELAALTMFRALIPATDAGYARFVQAVPALHTNGPDFAAEKQRVQEEYDKVCGLISAEKETIICAGNESAEKIRRAQVMVVAPDSKSGSYTYMDEEVIRFE
ncbi:MAG: hypothetical protein ACOX8Q_05505 [Christensenellales bacterium]